MEFFSSAIWDEGGKCQLTLALIELSLKWLELKEFYCNGTKMAKSAATVNRSCNAEAEMEPPDENDHDTCFGIRGTYTVASC